ncbi:hypothetical protein [Rhodococcus sp. KRD197]|uniref:hypothetical protein n=1 Tax=Rhodococcus sp. KRD197 TaxID=2729731 RepID=UPI003D160516
MSEEVADHSSPPTRWRELYQLIVDFSVPGRALAKASDGTETAQSLKAGNPLALITEAETLGFGTAAHAVVGRIRPDLLTVDLDGCADVIASGVLDAAETVNAPLVHLAASGSHDSVHIVLAPPTDWARTHLTSMIDELRVWAGYDTRAVDVLTPARYLRLPGAASLKPTGDVCRPIALDGTPLSALDAAARARNALSEVAASPAAAPQFAATGHGRSRPAKTTVSTTDRIVRTLAQDAAPVVVTDVAPRAWRRRKRFSYADWQLLMSHPAVGVRSDRATEAAWLLWRSGIRDWTMARWYYRNCPVFEKFAVRESATPGSSRAHWESIASRARAHRPPLSDTDSAVIGRVREHLCTWTDRPAQAIAMLAVLEHRFTDGHGLTDRPIAVRDLMSWLNVASIGTAKRLLDDLVEQRALVISIPYAQTAPREASRYSLVDPQVVLSQSHSEHDVTILGTPLPLTPTHGEPLSPLWGLLGAGCWQVYSHLLGSSEPVVSTELASAVGLPVGTRRSGCLRLLDALVNAQLVKRTGRGRATRWIAVAGDAVRRAEEATGALERLKAVRTRINAERASWHAETQTEHSKAQRVLRRIIDGLRDRAPKRQLELGPYEVDERTTVAVTLMRPSGRARLGNHRPRSPGRLQGRVSPSAVVQARLVQPKQTKSVGAI